MNKIQLRKKYAAIRKDIEQRAEKEQAINSMLEVIVGDNDIFIYVSFGSEVGTHAFIKGHERIFVPFTHDREMKCMFLKDKSDLTVDKLGNLASSKLDEISFLPSFTVVPMLAFNEGCYRLGYGGGYYDKFLASYSGVKIGLAFDEQYTEERFNELFDIPLDMIITPSGIRRK